MRVIAECQRERGREREKKERETDRQRQRDQYEENMYITCVFEISVHKY